MRKFPPQLVSDVTSLLHQGLSLNEIARKLSVSKKHVHKYVHKIKQKCAPDRVGCAAGRRKLLSDHQESLVVRKITSGKVDTAVDAAKILRSIHQANFHPDTVHRVLKRNGLYARAKVK